jgi:hypothetical protein
MKVKCAQCKKEINKNPREIRNSKTGNVFCSRSCSATYNNKKKPKRERSTTCKTKGCKNKILSGWTYCDECISQNKHMKYKSLTEQTLGEYISGRKKDSNRYTAIRKHAQAVMKDEPKKCSCGYDKHVECCHIKDIKDFDLNEEIININSKENLIYLCRNCHWEFDHGMLSIEEIKKREG